MKCKIELSAISTNFRTQLFALVLLFPVHLSQKNQLKEVTSGSTWNSCLDITNQLRLKKEEDLQTTLWENDWGFENYGRK